MLAARLNTDPLTYFNICQSLRAPTVRQDAIAEAIKKEFTGINKNYSDEVNTLLYAFL